MIVGSISWKGKNLILDVSYWQWMILEADECIRSMQMMSVKFYGVPVGNKHEVYSTLKARNTKHFGSCE